MAIDSATVLGWLKAAGEDSRLRLLALCAKQELCVSDLADVLRQSEPRVSRHLRILCEAGLLERLRQGQWVHYRLAQSPAPAAFVQALLAQMDRNDPRFARDRERVDRRHAGDAERGGAKAGGGVAADSGRGGARALESRLGRALKGFVDAVDLAPDKPVAALVVGVEHLELLETAAGTGGECVAIAHSRRAAQSARAFAERRGFACRVLLAASSNALCEKDIEAAGRTFDAVYLDHLAVPDSTLDGLLEYGRRALAPEGRLWLFERYESLEVPREKVVEHPIGRLRRLLSDVGMTCERLRPIAADGEHVLAAVAVPARSTSRGTGTAGAA